MWKFAYKSFISELNFFNECYMYMGVILRMGFMEEKRKRVIAVLSYIVTNKKISQDKLIGHFCFEWGLRYATVEEYLKELIVLGLIKSALQEDDTGCDIFPTDDGVLKMKEYESK